jgi:hypothetical protein
MKAAVQEMQAKVVEAQAEVPKALAKALGEREPRCYGLLPHEQHHCRYEDEGRAGGSSAEHDPHKVDHTK